MITSKKAANAVGGKTARACDSCLRKRARWYCTADDAFLCQGCDSSVHSANQLASRHERVRLEKGTPPNKAFFGSLNYTTKNNSTTMPAWLRGFTRKARTPRNFKPASKAMFGSAFANPLAIVPELGGEEAENSPFEESEEQLLYRVPVFDPFATELCNVPNNNNMAETLGQEREGYAVSLREKGAVLRDDDDIDLDTINGLIVPSDMEFAEFAADVESLLGTGLDEDCCGMEGLGLGLGLGLLECNKEDDIDDDDDDMGSFFVESKKVKVEEGVKEVLDCQMDVGFDLERETIDWNFGYEVNGEEEEIKMVGGAMDGRSGFKGEDEEVKRKVILSLNYEGVISAWASQGCPWTDGIRPELNADGGWPDFMGYSHPYGGVGSSHVRGGGDDGGREARVSRYREKRRTRLFSKKIRYEVRKLNAEKRPRMKGRFVKRTPFSVPPPFPSYLINTK